MNAPYEFSLSGTVLVTGGAGFIGSAVVRYLLGATDARVVNLDSLTYAGNLESVQDVATSPRYAFANADIRRPADLAAVLAEFRPSAVLHLAAETHVDRGIDRPAVFIETNCTGTLFLLEAVREFLLQLPSDERERFRLVHVSTDEVYGSLGDDGMFTESSPYAPRSPYSASKAASDHLALAWHHTFGLPVIVTNCSNNYGPYQFPDKLIPHVILSALEGKPVPVYGDGGNVRDWLYVDDHVRALLAVLERGIPGTSYNIGAGNEQRNIAVVEQVLTILDAMRPRADGQTYRSQISFVADRPGHDRRYAVDSSRIKRDLDWRPRELFATGLASTVAWYLDHEDWWGRIRRASYGGERLGMGT